MQLQEYDEWIATARQRTQERMAVAQAQFGMGTNKRYEIDLQTATIRFFDPSGDERIRAEIQVAGSWSTASNSWLWGWENQSVPAAAVSRMTAVRELGAQRQIDKLTTSFAPCDEGEAWSMASVASEIVDSQSVYRTVGAKNQLFLLLFSISRPA